MFPKKIRIVLLDWWLVLLAGILFAAPALAAENGPDLRTGEEAILAALDEKTEFQFIEEPLSSVIQYFKSTHRIEIQIDTRALQDVNMGTDTPITKGMQNITFRSGLNLVLHDLDLTWMIINEVLMITTPEEAELHLVPRVYDVANLVTVQDKNGNLWQDFDSLTQAIRSTVQPESWEGVGGPGSVVPLEYRGAIVLVVRQTHEVHGQVAKLLEELAKIASANSDAKYPVREKKPPQLPGQPFGPSAPGFGGGMGSGGMGGGGGGGMM